MTAGSVETIAHYRIEKRIGRGGMGIVYRAVDERDGRVVALKVIRDVETQGSESQPHVAEARIRFEREAGILKSLLHVNVVSFFEIGEHDGTPYLAMEYLDGLPLASYAGRPYAETLPLLIQAAHGMEYLASRGIVHRDLSPDNIFVVESGDGRIVKLLDFGIAKLFETPTGGRESLTATGFFLGKVAYGSPEQLGSLGPNATLDWRSDVYSLGVIFYQVLAGRRPFEGKAPVEYIAAHLNIAAPPVAAPPGAPALPMELVRVIGQMLEKRREDRPKSYRELVDRLVSVLRSGTDPGRPIPFAAGNGAERPGERAERPPTGPTALVGSSTSQSAATTLPAGAGSKRLTRGQIAASLALLGALAAVALWPKHETPSGEKATRLEPTPAKARATAPAAGGAGATLQIVATPFAKVEEILALPAKRGVPLEAVAFTPYVVRDPLAAGLYRVTLRCPALGGRLVEREVNVPASGAVLLNEPFLNDAQLLETLQ